MLSELVLITLRLRFGPEIPDKLKKLFLGRPVEYGVDPCECLLDVFNRKWLPLLFEYDVNRVTRGRLAFTSANEKLGDF